MEGGEILQQQSRVNSGETDAWHILLVLDDCCKRMHSRPGAQIDSTFRSDVVAATANTRHFRPSKTGFIVQHYAGDVSYDTHGFAESNRDELRNDLFDILVASSMLLTALYAEDQKERRAVATTGEARWEWPDRGEEDKRPVFGARGGSDAVRAPLRAVREDERREARVVLRRRARVASVPASHGAVVNAIVTRSRFPENVRVRRAGLRVSHRISSLPGAVQDAERATYPREWTGTDANGAREIVKAASKLGGVLSSLADGSETQFGRHKLFVKQPEVYAQLEKGPGREIRGVLASSLNLNFGGGDGRDRIAATPSMASWRACCCRAGRLQKHSRRSARSPRPVGDPRTCEREFCCRGTSRDGCWTRRSGFEIRRPNRV